MKEKVIKVKRKECSFGQQDHTKIPKLEVHLFFFFFCLGFFSQTFTNHKTSGEGGGHFLTTTSTRFTDTWTLAGRLLQRAHLCI